MFLEAATGWAVSNRAEAAVGRFFAARTWQDEVCALVERIESVN